MKSKNAMNDAVSRRVRAERQSQGLTLFSLLKRAGFPIRDAALSVLERGEARWTVANLQIIARALGVSMLYLLTGDPEMREPRPSELALPLESAI